MADAYASKATLRILLICSMVYDASHAVMKPKETCWILSVYVVFTNEMLVIVTSKPSDLKYMY